MKITARRVIAFLLLIAVSVGFGFLFDRTAIGIEKKNHPLPASIKSEVFDASQRYGIPASILWATVQKTSSFVSGSVSSDGGIGLLHITPELMQRIYSEVLEQTPPDAGMLYDPHTNLFCGSAWLSALYRRFGVWNLTLAAFLSSPETVESWLTDPTLLGEDGILREIPDAAISKSVKSILDSADYYQKLYGI